VKNLTAKKSAVPDDEDEFKPQTFAVTPKATAGVKPDPVGIDGDDLLQKSTKAEQMVKELDGMAKYM
jgi:DNA topoisomerase VI subunit B